MKNFRPTIEHAFYALVLSIAAGLRFVHLGGLPLSDYEANWALQALNIIRGLRPAVGPNPAYVHLTAILFYIFGATNFLARFWPALAGTALALLPWSLRGRIGRVPALILAFGLAIDPGLVAMAHLAGGPMLAITFLAFTAVLWTAKRPALAGLFAGLALLSGSSVWFGLLGVALAWAFGSAIGKKAPVRAEETREGEPPVPVPERLPRKEFRTALLWGGGTILVLGSLFIISPYGLSAFILSILTFLRGLWTLSDVQTGHLLLALPAYEILPLAFGIAGVVRGILKRDSASIRLGIWALVALVLALVYPGKQAGDLVWALLPLWVLTAMELGHHLDFEGHNRWELVGMAAIVVVLMVFGWLDLASITTMDLASPGTTTRLYLIIAVALLIVLTLLLVGAGWSAAISRLGGVWGGMFILTVFTMAMSTGAAGIREPRVFSLWTPEPRTGRVDVLLKVADQISAMNRGAAAELPITIVSVDSPALQWLFRDWQVKVVSEIPAEATPELVISPMGELHLSVQYRGEALPIREQADWQHATSANWLDWLVYRQFPVLREDVILWVRSDLMVDSQGLPAATP
jgi:hypothetical protein